MCSEYLHSLTRTMGPAFHMQLTWWQSPQDTVIWLWNSHLLAPLNLTIHEELIISVQDILSSLASLMQWHLDPFSDPRSASAPKLFRKPQC